MTTTFGSRSATWALMALVMSSLVVPSAQAAPTCFGKRATIIGDKGENIQGTPRADVIVAGSGSITVHGRGGNDRICLGFGGYDEAYG